MKLLRSIAALAAVIASACSLAPAHAEQSTYSQASERGSDFIARFPAAKQTWDNVAKFEINPALRALFSNSYGSSCNAIANPYPYQWCVDGTARSVKLYTQATGGGAFGWSTALTIGDNGSLVYPPIALGSIGPSLLAPGTAATNLGFLPPQSVAGRSGNVVLAANDITDGTAAGRALFTAASAAAQRTLLYASQVGSAHQFQTGYNSSGLATFAQPSFADISGTIPSPTYTGTLSGPGITSASASGVNFSVTTAFPALDMGSATQALTQTPYAGNVATTTSESVKGPSIQSNLRNFLSSHSMDCVTDAARNTAAINAYATAHSVTFQAAINAGASLVNASPTTIGCVVNYADIRGSVGSLQVWGWNTNTQQISGFVAGGGYSVVGGEINMNDGDAHVGDGDGDPAALVTPLYPSGYPNSTGLSITALGFRITAGLTFSTDGNQQFNRGVSFSGGSVRQCSVCDYASGAINVLDIRGSHNRGIDASLMTSGDALRVSKTGTIAARNAANTADVQMFGMSGADVLNIGASTAGIAFQANATTLNLSTLNVTPTTDGGGGLGSASLRYNGVWSNIFYPSPGYTFAGLPGGQPAGTTTYCTNCLKSGETTGNGSGMLVFFTTQPGVGAKWYTADGRVAGS